MFQYGEEQMHVSVNVEIQGNFKRFSSGVWTVDVLWSGFPPVQTSDFLTELERKRVKKNWSFSTRFVPTLIFFFYIPKLTKHRKTRPRWTSPKNSTKTTFSNKCLLEKCSVLKKHLTNPWNLSSHIFYNILKYIKYIFRNRSYSL